MSNRTKTYIAADWDGDKDLVDIIYKWNESDHWTFHFVDAHRLINSRDDSLACTIKKSLGIRLDASKTFVLIVGEHTKRLTKGCCSICDRYSKYYGCLNNNSISNKSFVDYECDKAAHDGLRIVVLYKATYVDKDKCPDVLRYRGIHVPAVYYENGAYYWDYNRIKDAIMGL